MRNICLILILIGLFVAIIGCSSVLEINATVNVEDAGKVNGTGQFERDSIVALKAEANEGYEFLRWEEDGKEVSKENPLVFPLEKRKKLEAVFRAKTYSINASSKDPEKGNVIGSGKYEYNKKVNLEARPKEGYKFIGWQGYDSKDKELEFQATKDLRLVAHFIKKEEILIDRKSLIPSVSNQNNMVAYMFEDILSIYSLDDKKHIADFDYSTNVNDENIKRQKIIKWLENDEGVLIHYNNELFIQLLNGEMKKIITGEVYKYNANSNLVGFIEYEETENNYTALIKTFDIDTSDINLVDEISINNLSQLDKALLILKDDLFIHPSDNKLNLTNFEANETEEITFDESINNLTLVNENVLAITMNNEIIFLNLENLSMISINEMNPSQHYVLSDYLITRDYMIAKYKQNSQNRYYLFEIKDFNSINSHKLFDIPNGEIVDLVNVEKTLLLQIDNTVLQINPEISKKLMQDEVAKVLTLVNKNIFYLTEYAPGYYWGIKYKDLNSKE